MRISGQDALVKIAKKLKKNNVAVDVVGFGDEDGNEDKLTAFHEAVNSGDNSHLVNIPVGSPLSDSLYGTPIFQGEGSGFGGIPGAGRLLVQQCVPPLTLIMLAFGSVN